MLNWRDPENPLAGGAERVTLGYLAGLVARGHEVYWFANAFENCLSTTSIRGINIIRGGGKGSSFLKAREWYRRQPPFDLVIDQHHGIPWYAPWWCRTNCVAYIHEVLGPIWKAFYPPPLSWIGQSQERWTHWLYRKVPFWTACESTRDQLLRHGVQHVTIIRYGVDTRRIPELTEKSLGSPLHLIVVSRLAPNKRIDHAIEVLRELKQRNIQSRLSIVGVGECEARLREQVDALNLNADVQFWGRLSEKEKDALLQQADLLLHTSQREGWGLNVIEANAMGTPAAVYPVAGLVESTQDNVTGLVARGETPALLADRVVELLSSPALYPVLRRNAWERSALFHWDNVLPMACDWLEEMAKGKK